jgi:biotin carboxyl carrier protein
MPRKLRITIEGTAYEVLVEDITSEEKREKNRHSARRIALPDSDQQPESDTNRRSPLNGVVVDIYVVEGEMVEKGQELIAIESMKIINTLTAHRNGKITKINLILGDSVTVGQTLITIE